MPISYLQGYVTLFAEYLLRGETTKMSGQMMGVFIRK